MYRPILRGPIFAPAKGRVTHPRMSKLRCCHASKAQAAQNENSDIRHQAHGHLLRVRHDTKASQSSVEPITKYNSKDG